MNPPDKVMYIYMLVVSFLIGGIIVDDFAERKRLGPGHALPLFYHFLMYSTVLVPLKLIMVFSHWKLKTNTLTKCKVNRLIGFGGIIFFSFLPRVIVYLKMGTSFDDSRVHAATIASTLIACSMFYLLFAAGMGKTCKWNHTKNKTLYKVLDCINLAIFTVAAFLATEFGKIGSGPFCTILFYQLGYFALCMFSVREFCGVINGAMELKEKTGDSVDLKAVTPSAPKPECQICLFPFNSIDRIPMILTGCGHTLCHQCVQKVLGQDQLATCPFCQKKTNVSTGELNKNYALLEIV